MVGIPVDLRPGDARPRDGRPAEDDAVEPALLGRRPAGRRDPEGRARGEGRASTVRGRAARPRRLRPVDVRDAVHRVGRRRAGVVPRHRLERRSRSTSRRRSSRARARGTTCKPRAQGRVRGLGLGSPRRHGERAVHGGRARADRGEGDRRPRQRTARRPSRSTRPNELLRGRDSRSSTRRSHEPAEYWQIEEGRAAEARGRAPAGRLLLPRPEGGPEPEPGAGRARATGRSSSSST